MSKYNFDTVIDRTNTNSVKWDFRGQIFGSQEVLPMWVADMDFPAPPPVVEAIVQRAQHGIYGYADGNEEYSAATAAWQERRFNWRVAKDWLVYVPGIVPALNWIVQTFTDPGESVVIQPPVYFPFFKAIRNNGREVLNNQLLEINGRYHMDLPDLEQKLASGAKMLILCSPHNPVGRVWTKEELHQLGNLCLRYNIMVVSDEIHSDLVYPEYKHTPFPMACPELQNSTIVCTAPSKTFNLAGLQISNLIIPNPELRDSLRATMAKIGISHPNVFGITALQTAYRYGEDWLEQLLSYLAGNRDFLIRFVLANMSEIKVSAPEGTYLVWLDFRNLGLQPNALREFLLNRAKVALNDGYTFGPGGEGFARINIACPRSTLTEGLTRIAEAIRGINQLNYSKV